MALGKAHPDHLLAELTWPQMAEWLAFGALEPIGDYRADVRAGVIAATLANVHRGRNQKAFVPSDFMPFYPRTQRHVAGEMRAFFNGLKLVNKPSNG